MHRVWGSKVKGLALSDRPKARSAKLVVQELQDETLVYDETNAKTLCLNRAAALVWGNCDGAHTIEQIAALATKGDTAVATRCIEQLAKNGLLEGVAAARGMHDPNRRAAFRRLATGAALVSAATALPVISVMVAPPPSQAASLGGHGAPCTNGSQCASGVCDSFFNTCA